MRLIDADALKEELKEIYHTEPVFIYTTVHEAIDNAPTVEPKTGRWSGVRYDPDRYNAELGIFVCNNCRKFSLMEYAFCPNCGADMRGDKNEAYRRR